MKLNKLLVILTVATHVFLPANTKASDEVVYLPIVDVLNSADAQEKLDRTVLFNFAKATNGTILKAGVVANRKTNAFGKANDATCQRAMLSSLIALQNSAKQAGASKVDNIVSYYKKNVYSSNTQYECHVGFLASGVALRGDLIK
ncbi:excinuclease ABC subunit A [Hydromonas duriensis]|uniref:Excinuclease ATPase subunit n=1 Tax=Hydromonas duriensis TaxID=1527608 RepID=A0A4R6Y5V6_9BURK|nr:excinuclease ABC subunit A [Hydromonas duriensis]TDR30742.1 hypothetical protein DFR44_11721 [Hydromonas duriensis]